MKTNMQASQKPLTLVIRSIHAVDGVVGFYRGIASPLVALTILNTMNFSSYAYFRSVLATSLLEDTGKIFEWRFSVAGAAAGPFAALISTPCEMVKTQQQLRRSNKSNGSVTTALQLLRIHGISSLYTGHMTNTFREIIFLSTYFTVYEHIKYNISNSLASIAVPMAGGIAGAVGWFVSFPLDNIKSNIQGNTITEHGIIKQKSFKVFLSILKQKGCLALYSGVTPSIMRAFIVSASRFSAYELTMATMKQ
jgi:solute carrier family 25 carnitine/acylcarnitine transporter 20/29